jgi:hypothetical protein
MLADSEAMSVDALTYLFNACAERIKKRPFSEAELELPLRVRNYRRELRRLYLELVPPTISVSALLIITFYTLKEAYSTLEGDEEGNDEEDVSIGIMLFFSTANLLLDVVNVTCFARAGSAFGLEVIKRENTAIRRTMSGEAAENMSLLGNGDTNVDKNDGENYGTTTSISRPEGPPELVNLNMCSAWTVRLLIGEGWMLSVFFCPTETHILLLFPLGTSMFAPIRCAARPCWWFPSSPPSFPPLTRRRRMP